MGTSTDGILVYGYDLGYPEDWKIENLTEDGTLNLPWYDEESEDAVDFGEAVLTRLLAELTGFTETWEDAVEAGTTDSHFGRKGAAEKQLKVDIVAHCSDDYPMFLLASRKVSAARGYPEDVTDEIAADVTADREHLTAALAALGITPKQTEPRWILASLWG